jgi:methionine-rich copper-binding protein CopC
LPLYLQRQIIVKRSQLFSSLMLLQRLYLLLLSAFCWVLPRQEAQAQCNLPAATNLQFSQPTPTTVSVSWNPVAGAIRYMALLESLNNGPQVPQTVLTVPPAASFTITPGHAYRFKVWAEGINPNGGTCWSPNYGEAYHKADYIVIDLIAQRTNCAPSGNFTTVPAGGTQQLIPGILYAAKLTAPSLSINVFTIQYLVNTGKYQIERFCPAPPGEDVQGQVGNSFGVYAPPTVLDASDVQADYDGLAYPIHVSFSESEGIHFEGPQGSALNLYTSCTGNHCSEGRESPSTVADPAPSNIQVVNPFADHLTLLFQEHPEQAITAQVFDVSGRMCLQTKIQPEQMAGTQYTLPTADLLPGMYFLRLETAPGVASTHKVVKYEKP